MTRTRLQGLTLWDEFVEEVYPNKPQLASGAYGGIESLTELSPHYRDMRTVLYNGTADQVAKQYIITIYSLAGEIMRQGTNRFGKPIDTYEEALKDATSRVEREIKKMNPNPVKFFDENSEEREKYAKDWIAWLTKDKERGKKYLNMLSRGEGMFTSKVMAMKDSVPKYLQDDDVQKAVLKSLRRAGLAK